MSGCGAKLQALQRRQRAPIRAALARVNSVGSMPLSPRSCAATSPLQMVMLPASSAGGGNSTVRDKRSEFGTAPLPYGRTDAPRGSPDGRFPAHSRSESQELNSGRYSRRARVVFPTYKPALPDSRRSSGAGTSPAVLPLLAGYGQAADLNKVGRLLPLSLEAGR